jgi:hypothetical protein
MAASVRVCPGVNPAHLAIEPGAPRVALRG